MSICIFCHNDSSTSKSVEHVIPESLGNKEHILPTGYVCDTCNNYFSIKIEKDLLAQPYFVSMRFRNEIITKKGKLVKEKMIFPSILKSCEVVMQTTGNGLIASFYADEDLSELIRTGKTRTMVSPYIHEPEYPNTIISRFLAKCAYEYFLYNIGKDKYNLYVEELLGSESDILKDLREYARYGKGKYWQYSQRRIYSEGYCFFNQDDNIHYEILHEMKLFPKEYKHYPNGNVEAEIYFLMCIASPLTDDTETLVFSLSDVNPILIKKDDNRIH